MAPISRAPSSGIRPRVREEEKAPVVVERVLAPIDLEDELPLEEAVPLSSDAALAVVLGFVVVAAGGLVAAFSVI